MPIALNKERCGALSTLVVTWLLRIFSPPQKTLVVDIVTEN